MSTKDMVDNYIDANGYGGITNIFVFIIDDIRKYMFKIRMFLLVTVTLCIGVYKFLIDTSIVNIPGLVIITFSLLVIHIMLLSLIRLNKLHTMVYLANRYMSDYLSIIGRNDVSSEYECYIRKEVVLIINKLLRDISDQVVSNKLDILRILLTKDHIKFRKVIEA